MAVSWEVHEKKDTTMKKNSSDQSESENDEDEEEKPIESYEFDPSVIFFFNRHLPILKVTLPLQTSQQMLHAVKGVVFGVNLMVHFEQENKQKEVQFERIPAHRPIIPIDLLA